MLYLQLDCVANLSKFIFEDSLKSTKLCTGTDYENKKDRRDGRQIV